MSALETLPQATSSTLYFGPWYRRSPFFERTLAAGCSAYDIYNHMYLPGYYADPVEEYWHLLPRGALRCGPSMVALGQGDQIGLDSRSRTTAAPLSQLRSQSSTVGGAPSGPIAIR